MSTHPALGVREQAPKAATPAENRQATGTAATHVTTASVWRELGRHSFAVLSHVNADGEPRSSGVVYAVVGHRLYVAVAPDSWKAHDLTTGDEVSLTVPVRRGGVLSMLFPIPPATISFHASATVYRPGAVEIATMPKELARLLPDAGRASACVIELVPEGKFLTYGLGVSLAEMRKPAVARAHPSVS